MIVSNRLSGWLCTEKVGAGEEISEQPDQKVE
jgi:hypothetical protein